MHQRLTIIIICTFCWELSLIRIIRSYLFLSSRLFVMEFLIISNANYRRLFLIVLLSLSTVLNCIWEFNFNRLWKVKFLFFRGLGYWSRLQAWKFIYILNLMRRSIFIRLDITITMRLASLVFHVEIETDWSWLISLGRGTAFIILNEFKLLHWSWMEALQAPINILRRSFTDIRSLSIRS